MWHPKGVPHSSTPFGCQTSVDNLIERSSTPETINIHREGEIVCVTCCAGLAFIWSRYGLRSLSISSFHGLSLATLPRYSSLDFRVASTLALSMRWKLLLASATQACGINISSILVTFFTETWVSQSLTFPHLSRPSLGKTYPGHCCWWEPPSSSVSWLARCWESLLPGDAVRDWMPGCHPCLPSSPQFLTFGLRSSCSMSLALSSTGSHSAAGTTPRSIQAFLPIFLLGAFHHALFPALTLSPISP